MREKFCPSSWLVAICRALPSRIMASQQRLRRAPGKLSAGDLRPLSTGMASTFTMKS